MGVDVIVHYPCDPKHAFGHGDQIAGVYRMLDMVKARVRARVVSELAINQGKDPDQIEFEMVQTYGGQPAKRVVRVSDMLEIAKPLEQYSAACKGCPANTMDKPYGCSIGVRYPITTKAQEWMLEQLQPPGTVGRDLFVSILERYELQGKYVQHLRRSGIFEAGVAREEQILGMPLFSDLVFEMILGVGEYLRPIQDFRVLPPKYALAVLICLGCLRVGGQPPRSKDDLHPVEALEGSSSVTDRRELARFDVGEQSSEFGIAELQGLLYSVYTGWVVQAPLLVWT
jgi:hypothetical protein